MIRPAYCLGFMIALAWVVCPTPALAQQGPRELRCEKDPAPLAVKVEHPQLSWTSIPNQRAYQVLVATSEEKLKADEGDLWDSGRVVSGQNTTQYRGKALSSLQRCYWKVRIWGNYYQATRYSEPASWKMGLLSFHDQSAN